jgi:hypothetical protein
MSTLRVGDRKKESVMASVSPVVGAGLTLAGWVVVVNVGWQLLSGLTQALLCEARSQRPLECLPAWTQMNEIGRRSTDTLLALVVHSPVDSAAAALGGMAGGVLVVRRRQEGDNESDDDDNASQPVLSGPIGIVPSPPRADDGPENDPEPA